MIATSPYNEQEARWPQNGRHILAQYDDDTVVVYQAYRPSIGQFASRHGHFGGSDFSFSRMSWIKPNFLWMMYRSGWATKSGQEVVLAIRLWRRCFDALLGRAVASGFDADHFATREAWQEAVRASDVRLQWDPDHDPSGAPVARRAIQLGLRGEALAGFGGDAISSVDDITDFVAEQRVAAGQSDWPQLVTPAERVYPVPDAAVRQRIGLSDWP